VLTVRKEMFIKQECYNPCSIEPRALNHWIECVKQPGALRGVLETYRAGLKNGEIHQKLVRDGGKLKCRVMTIGAPEFFGPTVEKEILRVAESVERSELFEECGHSLALEKPERLARLLREFFLRGK
jgi:pimeloyl-ACP methyl ester carboxylesterase